jgi:Domain of unknown function (DUF4304)
MGFERKEMEAALKRSVVPFLRGVGFRGTFPHFRRTSEVGVELLTFQFHWHGGGFVVETARCTSIGIVTRWGKAIHPDQAKATDLPPDSRRRIQANDNGGPSAWFRFDDGRFDNAARQVLQVLAAVMTEIVS